MSRTKTPRRGLPTAGVAAPADRRFRRPGLLPERRRRVGRSIWGVARWLVPLVLVVAAAVFGAERLMATDLFRVRTVTVRGNQQLSTSEIEALIPDLRAKNVFDVDFEEYRSRLLDSSWVESVAMSRVLPSTVIVDIVERAPMAIARLDRQLYLVDGTGNIIDEHRPEYREFDLPIIDGLLTAPKAGAPLATPGRIEVTAALIAALDARPDLRARLSQVDVSNERDVIVMFDDDPAWIHLGDMKFAERLQQYVDLRPTLESRFGSVDYVDLRFGERVYVRGQGQRQSVSSSAR